MLPVDYGPPTDPHDAPGEPLVESVWVEPYPDETLGLEDGYAAPEARYEQREAVELAFIAALQHLPANQRAVLILREVLGFSAKEVAETLETTVRFGQQRAAARPRRGRGAAAGAEPAGHPALARRRRGARGRARATWTRGTGSDIEAVVAMLTEDASFSMPPAPSWYRGREALIATSSASGRCRATGAGGTCLVRANGQPALAFYSWDEGRAGRTLPFALNVLTHSRRADQRRDSVHRRARRSRPTPRRTGAGRRSRMIPERFVDFFERFGLPEALPA